MCYLSECGFSESPKVFCPFYLECESSGWGIFLCLSPPCPIFSQGLRSAVIQGWEPSSCHFGSPESTHRAPDILLYCHYDCRHRVVVYWPFRHGCIPKWGNSLSWALPGLVARRMCCWDSCCWLCQITLWQQLPLIGETLLAPASDDITTPLTHWS